MAQQYPGSNSDAFGAASAFEGAWALAYALNRIDSTKSRPTLNQELDSFPERFFAELNQINFNSLTGRVAFDPEGNREAPVFDVVRLVPDTVNQTVEFRVIGTVDDGVVHFPDESQLVFPDDTSLDGTTTVPDEYF
eukprot:GABV01001374.1.p1 GENE.GABV01001374.1~~GABV01001374.1.p1  ORF type:complete len:136 (-),score=45.56 GABV01001374.1:134-541(-)